MRVKDITEPKACGDCFVVAGRSMIDGELPDLKLVHAYVHGQGPLEGRRFSHAWNEIGDVVLDYSNGNKVMMRKEQYYKLGGVDPVEPGAYAEYNKEEALKQMLRNKHWGPWGLDDSLAR